MPREGRREGDRGDTILRAEGVVYGSKYSSRIGEGVTACVGGVV